jgi:hypothetical protein
MQSATKDQLLKMPTSDVCLMGIEWLADGSLRLTLELPGIEKRVTRLTCSFVSGLHIDFSYKERAGGRPMTWDTTFAELPDGSWHALLDFAGLPKQSIEFGCLDIQLEYV